MTKKKSGRSYLESYLNWRGSHGAQSTLSKMGTGGSGQPTSDMNGAAMSAMTVGICIDRCPIKAGLSRMYGKSILKHWVDQAEAGYDTKQIERTDAFIRGVVWLEGEMERRLSEERRLR